MSNPKLLMLDEPSMGLAPILIEQIFQIVEDLHKAGTTVLLVEQTPRWRFQSPRAATCSRPARSP